MSINIPILRWGQPYTSLEVDEVTHFATGEPIAAISRANGGLVQRDMRRAWHARDALRAIPIDDLISRAKHAGELYANATLPIGDGTQTPDEFVRAQSATTGIPERLCRANMKKNLFVLGEMDNILASLTRGLSLDVLSSGYGEERGVPISYQAQTPVLGLVLPSNSPGVHTLWLPIIPMQLGLVIKPGPQEPWTPYRMAEAFFAAGIPREAISIYPGAGDVGAAVVDTCPRTLIFGSEATVDRYRGNPRVQAHGPGFSKILLGDDQVDQWATYLDTMVESVSPTAAAAASMPRESGRAGTRVISPTRSHAGWPRSARSPRTTRMPASQRLPCPAWPTRSRSRSTATLPRPASRT